MRKIFTYIKADQFFPAYCPDIRNYKHKISGKNTKGNPLDFTEQEKKQILKGLKQLFKDIQHG